MKKIAVALSGCGFLDGAEITESVSTLIALSELEAQVEVFAPKMQIETVDHLRHQQSRDKRDLLVEAARIARGHIRDFNELSSQQFDGLVFPGGFGVAKHLCDWAENGAAGSVLPLVQRVIEDFYQEQKPILGICIAPALLALALGQHGVIVTLGQERENAAEIEKTGTRHENCDVTDFITDRAHRLVTTPAYMYENPRPFDVYTGIRKAVREFFEMA